MGRNDWAKAIDNDDWTSVTPPKRNASAWQVAVGLLLVAGGAFTFGYYVPLYRAHSELNSQYLRLSKDAAGQRQQLTDTVAQLKQVASERDQLLKQAGEGAKREASRQEQLERLERNLAGLLGPYRGKGVSWSRDANAFQVLLSTPVMVGLGTAELTATGKKVVCALAARLKATGHKVVATGFGIGKQPKGKFSFALATERAGAAAQQLQEECGLSASQVGVAVDQSLEPVTAAVRLVIAPSS